MSEIKPVLIRNSGEHKEIIKTEHKTKYSAEEEMKECNSDAEIHEINEDPTNAATIKQSYYFIESSSSELQSEDIQDKNKKNKED